METVHSPVLAKKKLGGRSEWAAGWPTVVSGSLGGGFGAAYFTLIAGMFIVPLQKDFGWSRTALSIGPAVNLICALLLPFVAVLISKTSSRTVALAGLAMLIPGYVLLSIVPANYAVLAAIVLFFGVANAMTTWMTFTKGVTTWFNRQAGTALAVTLCGSSILIAATAPMVAYVIDHEGWRYGFLLIAAMLCCIALPAVFIGFRENVATQPARNVGVAEIGRTAKNDILKSHKFWLLFVSVGGAAFPIGGFSSQLQPILMMKLGSSLSIIGFVTSLYFISLMAGRLVVGVLLDFFPPAMVAAGSLLCAALGMVLFATGLVQADWRVIIVAALLIGMAQGAEGEFIGYFAAKLFDPSMFSIVYSLIGFAVALGFSAGGFIYAIYYDLDGNYDQVLWLSASALAFFATTIAWLKVPRAN